MKGLINYTFQKIDSYAYWLYKCMPDSIENETPLEQARDILIGHLSAIILLFLAAIAFISTHFIKTEFEPYVGKKVMPIVTLTCFALVVLLCYFLIKDRITQELMEEKSQKINISKKSRILFVIYVLLFPFIIGGIFLAMVALLLPSAIKSVG